jgi:hypothetical protein
VHERLSGLSGTYSVRRQVRPGKVTLRDHDYRLQPGYKTVMTSKKIVLSTGAGATITLEEDRITTDAGDVVNIYSIPTPRRSGSTR